MSEEDKDPAGETKTYEFDEDFQQELTALIVRDAEFNAKIEGLVAPAYLTDHANGSLVRLATDYFNKYRMVPSERMWPTLVREAIDQKVLRKDDAIEVLRRWKELQAFDLTESEFIIERVADFARRSALEQAIYDAVDLLEKGKFEKIEGLIKTAMNVGVNEETNRYDFWENIESRAEYRQEVLAGRIKPDGVTTGFKEFDQELYNRGWGRRELSVLMAPAKGGKSMALIGFGLAACLAGLNVAYVTLEVSARIIADRSDANISGTRMADLQNAIGVVKGRVQGKATSSGKFDLYDFPTGSLSPGDLRRLLARKKSQGVKYDLIIVDYADLMRPDMVSQESRENSRLIYVGLRAIAQEFNAAVLSATQTNREGFKATAGRMEHVSEDINKARTVDLLVSLNASEEEKKNNEARIYFAASRNQRSDMTIRVRTDFERARYIAGILAIE